MGWGHCVARARSLSEFQTSFPDETSCAAFLFERRWPQGFVRPACGGGRAALLKSRAHTHECLDCGRQTSITAGTAMHRSKLPLTVWFWTAHLIEAFVRANVKTGTTLLTDGHRSYPGLTDYRHDPRTVGKMAGHIVLPWIHRGFALMKRWGLGTYHGLRRKHIDTYLNEFVFRYNRRFYRHVSFETMLGLASHHHPTSYWDIIGRHNPRKGVPTVWREPRRRRTATGMRQTDQDLPRKSNPTPFRIRPASPRY
jgi:transposase-like protein